MSWQPCPALFGTGKCLIDRVVAQGCQSPGFAALIFRIYLTDSALTFRGPGSIPQEVGNFLISKFYKELKFFLYLIQNHAMKTYGGVEV
jgi:hypothetical protein